MRIPWSRNKAVALLFVFIVSIVVNAVCAWPVAYPPYIDSFYYVDMARSLSIGHGLTENFAWNYLGGMPAIPHAGSTYWLPGLSLLLSIMYRIGGDYHSITLAMSALAAISPMLAAYVAWDIFQRRDCAVIAAALTLFNGVYFHNWTTPDAFVPYAALATLAMILTYKGILHTRSQSRLVLFFSAGIVMGLATLFRQEGALLFVAAIFAVGFTYLRRSSTQWLRFVALIVGGYALVQVPWSIRSAGIDHGAGLKTLWMRSYDAFYALNTSGLTLQSYLAWGLKSLVSVRVHAILFTLTIWLFIWLVILVIPLLLGIRQLWRREEMRPFIIYWAILAACLPLIFTMTIEHGTLPHASGALIPFGSVLVVAGLQSLSRRAGETTFRVTAVVCILFAAYISVSRSIGNSVAVSDEYRVDVPVVKWLQLHNALRHPVMVSDPPAFSYIQDAPYVIPPSDGLSATHTVINHYGVRYWAIDENFNKSAWSIVTKAPQSWLHLVASYPTVHIYAVTK